ncbi:MAG: metal-dependent transcriptional regulator [Flavobacteriales bacterium]|nr:metal-dependent transcriptional regulator [Flavobacteriales bacterium]
MTTLAEENYLKAILKLSNYSLEMVSTNAIAKELKTKASSVTEMNKKLTEKKLVKYQKYKGVSLSTSGYKIAIYIVRKHRLWECFLVSKLQFDWDEVHHVAEQLEHIKSSKLIDSLDIFLGKPKKDPHGEPIPNINGEFPKSNALALNKFPNDVKGEVIGLTNDMPSLLKYLDSLSITIGSKVVIKKQIDFDNSFEIIINNTERHISNEVAKTLLIREL